MNTEEKTSPKGCPKCNCNFHNSNPRYKFCPYCTTPLLMGHEWIRYRRERIAAQYAEKVLSSLQFLDEGYTIDDLSIGGIPLKDIISNSL